MTAAFVYGFLAFVFLLLLLYSIDLLVFIRREKKRFETDFQTEEYIVFLVQKQKRAKHPQKKNYYLYLICLALTADGQTEKMRRLLPFLKNDPLLGVLKSDF